MMYLRFCLFIYLCFTISCSNKVVNSRLYNFECKSGGDIRITLRELLKNPKLFDNKFIEITGFYQSGFEKSFISLSKIDIVSEPQEKIKLFVPEPEMLVKKSSDKYTWDQSEINKMSGRKIRVVGRFEYYEESEIGDSIKGILKNVCLIEVFE